MKKLLVAALMVVLASPAFAAIQNVKVSGDITTSWVNDHNLDLGATTGSQYIQSAGTTGINTGGSAIGQKKQNVFLTQTRLRVDADLSDNVSTEVGLINERAWNAENQDAATSAGYANDTNVQLYLASLTLREFLYSPLTLTIGRQVFNYGNGLVMGNGGPVNAAGGNLANIYANLTERTAYDGVTATLDYKPLTISLIYFKNYQSLNSLAGNAVGTGFANQNSDVFGYNANYQLSDPWSTVVEQYMFARVNGGGVTDSSNGAVGTAGALSSKSDELYVPGLRASTNPIKGLNVQGEVAWELGTHNVQNPAGGAIESEQRDAMAAQFLASYSLPVLEKYKPSVNAAYTYVSGDKNGNVNYDTQKSTSAKHYTAWDEFNTIQGAGTIYRALFPLSNESIVSVGASANPLEDVTTSVTWSGLWSVAPYSNGSATSNTNENPLTMLQPNGNTVTALVNHNGYWLGNETDLNMTYNYTEDVTFGLSVGWFVPGDVFQSGNHTTASQAIANVAVTF